MFLFAEILGTEALTQGRIVVQHVTKHHTAAERVFLNHNCNSFSGSVFKKGVRVLFRKRMLYLTGPRPRKTS